MIKILTLILIVVVCGRGDEDATGLGKPPGEGRQKRLLFFDEQGNLVKTYRNPYLQDWALNADNLPHYGSYMNPFFSFIRQALGGSLAALMIPVSNNVIQQINRDPNYHNLLIAPKQDSVIEPNPSCAGKRAQIPSPGLCSNFLNCWDGWAVEQQCPTGLLFSSEGYCDYSDNVDCKNRKLETPQPKPEPQCNKDFEAFRNQLNCNEFFVCVNRQPIRFKCPADLAYSQILGICDYPNRVDCSSNSPSSQFPAYPQPANPAIPVVPAAPAPMPPSAVPSPGTEPTQGLEPVLVQVPGLQSPGLVPGLFPAPIPLKPVENTVTNTVFDSQSWSSTHVAMSRQDAIRQLQLKNK